MTIAASTRDKIIQWQALKTPANSNEQNLYDLLSVFSTYHSSLAQTTQLKLDQWLDDSIVSLQGGGSGIGSSDFTQLNIAAAGLEYNPWSLSMRQMIAFDDYLDLLLGGIDYSESVLATSPLAYWQLAETSGATIVDSSGNGYDGQYTGVQLAADTAPQGTPAPFWDGANDVGALHSAGFASACDLDEGCVLIWIKAASGAWTDGAPRRIITLWRDVGNRIQVLTTATNNTVSFYRTGSGTAQSDNLTDASIFMGTGWISLILSWSVLNNELKYYVNGSQVGTTKTGLVAAAGSGLDSDKTALGAFSVASPSSVWHGPLGQAILWNRPIDNDILALGTV